MAGNPENEELYTDVDRFHMQQDKIKFDGGAGDSSDSVGVVVAPFFFSSFASFFARATAVVDSSQTLTHAHTQTPTHIHMPVSSECSNS